MAIQTVYMSNTITGWWFGTFFIFPYIGKNHPNWLSYFSEGLQPPISYNIWLCLKMRYTAIYDQFWCRKWWSTTGKKEGTTCSDKPHGPWINACKPTIYIYIYVLNWYVWNRHVWGSGVFSQMLPVTIQWDHPGEENSLGRPFSPTARGAGNSAGKHSGWLLHPQIMHIYNMYIRLYKYVCILYTYISCIYIYIYILWYVYKYIYII